MTHTHRFRPLWLLVTSPADLQGWHRVITYAECLVCHERATLAAWQSPRHRAGRLAREDEA